MSKNKYPHGDTTWFVKDRFGLFIHWGLYALPARHEWVKKRESLTTEDYQKYFDRFEPDLYDPKEWAAQAKAAGMKYVVLTAKHHEGFCLWDSKYTEYKITNTPYGKDALKTYADAFREAGLRVGFYYSLIDWHHPEFIVDSRHPRKDDPEEREKNKNRDMSKYAQYMRDQVTELLTEYGQIDIIWFDFSYPGEDGKGHEDWESEALLATVRKCQPDIIINNRLDLKGAGDIETPEQFQPHAPLKDADGNNIVWEACQTLSGSWGYHRDEMTWKSTEQLLWMLIDGVSKNGNLLLNVGPTARGELDYRAQDRLTGIAQWMRYNSRAIYHCGPAPEGFVAPEDCRYTYNADTNRLYLHILNYPFRTIHLPELADKVDYVQFLHDASEIKSQTADPKPEHSNTRVSTPEGALTLHIPVNKPPVTYPVVEIFLR